MKKTFLIIILLTILIVSIISVNAVPFNLLKIPSTPLSGTIISPPPQDNPLTISPNSIVNFQASVSGGTPPYTYVWSFCSDDTECSPRIETVQDPGDVTYNKNSPHTVLFTVTDDVGASVTKSFTIKLYFASITKPAEGSGWNMGDNILFEGQIENGSSSLTYDYSWDFDDGTTESDLGLAYDEVSQVNHVYSNIASGAYNVVLTITNSDGDSFDSSLLIYIANPIPTEFECVIKNEDCLSDEMELMRFYRLKNSHVKPFDASDKNTYTYPLCCKSSALITTTTSQPTGANNIFLTTQTDYDSASGGAHQASPSNELVTYYLLGSNVGAGAECISTTGECSDLEGNKKCLYEFAGDNPGGYHFANCTLPAETNNYPNKMCCEIAEDCTNNFDDNLNGWTDCSDAGICTIPSFEQPCGISETSVYDECSWYDNYIFEYGYNFSAFSDVVLKDLAGGPSICYQNVVSGYPNCDICLINDVLDYYAISYTDCPSSGSPSVNDLTLPDEITGDNPAETFGRCRLYYCSKGQNEDLPAFVSDMNANAIDTRHCCPQGTYWDPTADFNNDGVLGECRDFSECYNPNGAPLSMDCDYDFLTEFSTWIDDYNLTDPVIDCVDETFDFSSSIRTCCPVWKNNLLTYDYSNIEYYLQT